MDEHNLTNSAFIGYEYRDVTVDRSFENMYADGYENFGWKLDNISNPMTGSSVVTMKFKRDRKITNKAELTRLQRQFDSCIKEISNMEKSKSSTAASTACIVGILGTAFMAGATFAFTSGYVILCIILAIPAFIGWISPYFIYKFIISKKTIEMAPLIESKYDEIYEVSERASSLLVHL